MNFEIFECFEKHVDFDALSRGECVLKPNRYHILRGGRGSGKSVFAANALVLEAYMADVQVLCLREFMNSLADSSMALIWESIENFGLDWFFTKTKTEIVGKNGSRFFFKGLRTNATSIKSLAKVDRVLCEESEGITEDSWSILTPSIRTPGARFIIIYNPRSVFDATHQRFAINPPSDSIETVANWCDNPRFPAALEQERLDMLATDPDRYLNVWGGEAIGDTPLSIIPSKWLRACVDIHKRLGIEIDGHRQAGLDVSGGGSDPNAIALMTGQVVTGLEEFRQGDPTSAAYDAWDKALRHGIDAFTYDSIGVGAGVGQTLSEPNYKNTITKGLGHGGGIKIHGFNAGGAIEKPDEVEPGNAKTNKESFSNLKAQSWWRMRYRAQQSFLAANDMPYDSDAVISFSSERIAPDTLEKLIFELSTPQREYVGSKLKVESKEKLAKRGISSHNLADALLMAAHQQPVSVVTDALSARRRNKASW